MLFKVRQKVSDTNLHIEEKIFAVYAILPHEVKSEDFTKILIYDNGEWNWVFLKFYEPIE